MSNENQNGPEPRGGEQEPIVIRDKRRVDPSGQPRTPDPADGADTAPQEAPVPTEEQLGEIDRLTTELAERTTDLQRVTAEYANYRRRTDREREELIPVAQSALLTKLLPVLDDIDRADEHGDLTGGFKTVADSLRQTLASVGLEQFGAPGDEFDPQIHEAVSHSTSADAESEAISAVMRKGYRSGERILRNAMVAVVAPE